MKHLITSTTLLLFAAFCTLACTGKPASGENAETDPVENTDVSSAPGEQTTDPVVVTLKQLFEDKESFADRLVQVTGRCVKINKNIMGMNWAHIRDGSDPDEDYDLTVTTQADVPVDEEVTMVGKIVLGKDFGSGYQYDILMEDGLLK